MPSNLRFCYDTITSGYWFLLCLFHYKPPPNLVASNHNNIHLLTSLWFGFSLVKRFISILHGICWDCNVHCCVWSLSWMSETSGAWLSITFFSVQPLYRTSLASSLHGGRMAAWPLTYLLAFFSECESRGSQAYLVPELWKPQNVTSVALFLSKGQALI